MKTLKNISIKGKNILCRLDLNVPLDNKIITDPTRINSCLPTLNYILNNKPKSLTIMSHLGRPKSSDDLDNLSLKPIAEYLQNHFKTSINLIKNYDTHNENYHLENINLLENLRFNKGEESNCDDFAKILSKFGEVYINDAFGTTHRKHASVHKIVEQFKLNNKPVCGGFLLNTEVNALDKLYTKNKNETFVAILGGLKVSDKVNTIENLLNYADKILIGGAMAYPFLKSRGISIGSSPCNDEDVEIASKLYKLDKFDKIIPRIDHVIHPINPKDSANDSAKDSGANDSANDFSNELIKISNDINIPNDYEGLDIGPLTISLFQRYIQSADKIFWNGPMGLFENELFELGTLSIAKLISKNKNCYSVVGGGDSVAAITKLENVNISHICTGGGASLEYLSKGRLPGIDILKV